MRVPNQPEGASHALLMWSASCVSRRRGPEHVEVLKTRIVKRATEDRGLPDTGAAGLGRYRNRGVGCNAARRYPAVPQGANRGRFVARGEGAPCWKIHHGSAPDPLGLPACLPAQCLAACATRLPAMSHPKPPVIRMFEGVSAGRRRNMQAIRGTDTKPEMAVRRLLHGKGYRYRLHRRDLPGKPDLVFPARRKIIEVRGCFWHRHSGCRSASTPATRSDYWQTKFATNVARDERNLAALRAAGWSVLVVWECEVANPSLARRLTGFLGPPGQQTRSSKA